MTLNWLLANECHLLLWKHAHEESALCSIKDPRECSWLKGGPGCTLQVAPLPKDLLDRRVEITGPVDRKMVINAFNSGASCYMADFEDSNAPTWYKCCTLTAHKCQHWSSSCSAAALSSCAGRQGGQCPGLLKCRLHSLLMPVSWLTCLQSVLDSKPVSCMVPGPMQGASGHNTLESIKSMHSSAIVHSSYDNVLANRVVQPCKASDSGVELQLSKQDMAVSRNSSSLLHKAGRVSCSLAQAARTMLQGMDAGCFANPCACAVQAQQLGWPDQPARCHSRKYDIQGPQIWQDLHTQREGQHMAAPSPSWNIPRASKSGFFLPICLVGAPASM